MDSDGYIIDSCRENNLWRHRELYVTLLLRVIDEYYRGRRLYRGFASRKRSRTRTISSSVLSSPAQKINSTSRCWYNIHLMITPLFTAIGFTSRFFLPASTSIILLCKTPLTTSNLSIKDC
ncbi:hypothetical protein BDR03DRAFT_947281 [Suillus americanus]|nr:hypothetical protein BDR03DRAFT_947281 [Suillus americanus]